MNRRLARTLPAFALGGSIAAVIAVTTVVASPNAGAIQQQYRIVPGESMGPVDLGMKRKKVERLLPGRPTRSHDSRFYSLVYNYPDKDSGKLIITFNGLKKKSKAFNVVTAEPNLATNQNVGVGDRFFRMLGNYPSVNCYHSDPDGSRDEDIEETENQECELRSNGGYTYFSFASLDADPQQKIGAIAISAIRIP